MRPNTVKCRYCREPIDISRKGNARLPRRDRGFCDDLCRYAYHAHLRYVAMRRFKAKGGR
jgi:hypothetical protein